MAFSLIRVLSALTALRRPVPDRGRSPSCVRLRLELLEDRTLLSGNPIVAENQLPGTPQSVWDIQYNGGGNSGDPTIQGYATDISYNQGQTVSFKINDTANAPYRLDIYRMGYYQGNGARLVAQISSSQTVRKAQPNPITNATTGEVDAGNWSVTASWAIPANAVSGIYFAHVIRTNTGGDSHIVFIVRDDNDPNPSDLLFQTSDATWEAYNTALGGSLYDGGVRTSGPYGGAYAVSYNRPFDTRDNRTVSWVFNAEYPMVRWLEANGFNVSYFTDMDADRFGAQIKQHKVYLSVGHDEYWSGQQRANVEAALTAGVNLAFFSANEVFWKTYWAPSIDGSNTPYRTLVCYKETFNEQQIDPNQIWTGTWRDPTLSPPLDGGRPENALTGTLFMVNGNRYDAINVPANYAALRFWRNTAIANLTPGTSYTLPTGTLGYEWDVIPDDGFEPPGSVDMSSTTIDVSGQYLLDYGGAYTGIGTATHSLHLYRNQASKALVFGAGTVQWSWGLDGNHDLSNNGSTTDVNMQQATVNLFADMGAQPGSLMSGLVPATASTDTIPPVSSITSLSNGQTLLTGAPVTITGTATDSGGVVAGVEISVDGGQTWHPAALAKAAANATWSYTWTPGTPGTFLIETRAVDDSGNLETPSDGVNVTTILQGYTVFSPASQPGAISSDTGAVEVGVEFTSSSSGSVSAIRFYRPALLNAADTAPNAVELWTASGHLLASALAVGETTGWQQVSFSSPVAIQANTTYIASYFTTYGGYAADLGYFSTVGVTNGPLTAPATGSVPGGNGVYAYASSTPGNANPSQILAVGNSTFPNQTYQGTNYWVDVVFTTPNTTNPIIYSVGPAPGATRVSTTSRVTVTFNKAMNASTINSGTVYLTDQNGNVVASTVSYDSKTQTAFLTPNAPLAGAVSYTLTVLGGSGTAVKDSSGNPLAATYTSTFFTLGPAPTVASTAPAAAATGVSNGSSITVTFSHAMTASSITGSTFFLKDAGGNLLPAAVSFDPTSNTAALTTRDFLSLSTTYTATIVGGAGGVKDANGTPLASSYSWSFTTAATGAVYPSIFRPTAAPKNPSAGSAGSAVQVGVKFTSSLSGVITGVRFYKGTLNTGTHVGNLWTLSGQLLATATFTNETASGWQQVNFSSPVPITANTTYVASYFSPSGYYAQDQNYFSTTGVTGSPLQAPSSPASNGNGVYAYGASNTFPGSSYNSSNYWVDVVYQLVPVITAVSPAAGAIQVSATAPVTVAFSEAMDPTTLTTSTIVLKDPNGNVVPATVSYNSSTFTATLTPSAPLAGDTVYTVSVLGGTSGPVVKDQYGNALLAASTWSFQTDGPAPVVVSTTPSSGATGVSTAANVSVVFSHAMDPTTLTTSTILLKDAAGNAVTGALSYNASNFTATFTPNGFFTTSAVYTLTVLGGSGTAVKDVNGRPLAANYSWSFTVGSQPTPYPSLWKSAATPSAISTDGNAVTVGVKFYSTASGYVTGVRFYKGTLNTGTHVGSLWTLSGQLLATATFTNETASGWQQVNFSSPVPITANTTYVASYFAPNGHYADDQGYFNTAGADAYPLHAPATGAVVGGNGVYAYGASSSFPGSTYNGSNYWVDVVVASAPMVVATTPSGGAAQVSATAPVTATFNEAVDPTTINSNTFYLTDPNGNVVASTISYNSSTFTAALTPNAALSPDAIYTATVVGGASGVKDLSGFALAGNSTWSFTVDGPAPVVNAVSPGGGITGVGTTVAVSVVFSHAMDQTTLTTSTILLQAPNGSVVQATLSYNPANFTATLAPNGFFAPGTTYTVTVLGGASGTVVKDVNGRSLAGNYVSTFTTTAQPSFYPTLWRPTATPAAISGDSNAVTVGVKFYSSVNGSITGVRFYKGAGNTGTHVGSLWTLSGQLLATATFANETASGWQQVNFSSPVAITANTTYVATYFAPNGHYAADQGYFNSAGWDGTLLHAPATGAVAGGDGVYAYGASSSFPTSTYNGTNYWVDVVLYTPPAITATTPASGATNVSRTAAIVIAFDRALNPATINGSTFVLKDASGSTVAATVTYDPTTFKVTVTPLAPLAANTTYTMSVVGGSSGVQDAYGDPLAATDLWSFTTGS